MLSRATATAAVGALTVIHGAFPQEMDFEGEEKNNAILASWTLSLSLCLIYTHKHTGAGTQQVDMNVHTISHSDANT